MGSDELIAYLIHQHFIMVTSKDTELQSLFQETRTSLEASLSGLKGTVQEIIEKNNEEVKQLRTDKSRLEEELKQVEPMAKDLMLTKLYNKQLKEEIEKLAIKFEKKVSKNEKQYRRQRNSPPNSKKEESSPSKSRRRSRSPAPSGGGEYDHLSQYAPRPKSTIKKKRKANSNPGTYDLPTKMQECIRQFPEEQNQFKDQDQDHKKDERNKICIPFLTNKCMHGNECPLRHPEKDDCKEILKNINKIICNYGPNCKRQDCVFNHDSHNLGPRDPHGRW